MNTQKTPYGQAMNEFARSKALDAIQQSGRSLPAVVTKVQGAIVTVKFEITGPFTLPPVTVPTIGSEYVRHPIQVGCKGFVIAADAYLGGMSGIGGGTADLTQRANLTALVFAPIGNKDWVSVDGQKVVIYGPTGVTLRDQGNHCILTLTPTGISVTVPSGNNMSISVTGGGAVNVSGGTVNITSGDVTADGISLKHHVHSGVMAGGSNTGQPV